MQDKKIKIGITQGDINGIGYEVIIKGLMDHRILEVCTPIVYGSPKVAAYHRKALNIENFSFHSINSPLDANEKKPNIINCIDEEIRVELGKSTPAAGQASYLALEAALKDLNAHKIDAIVTAPINKHNIQSEAFHFKGHTEFFQSACKVEDVLMLMISNLLKVGVVAGHVPFNQIHTFITVENILNKLRILNKSLKQDFAVRKPKIAVLSLNPHAGDNGLLGNEEQEIINPALEKAKSENMIVLGPYPSDGFFGSASFMKFDAVLAMYHDQGLAPFKSLVPDEGVNYTAGLPIIRTSPTHGTAYEIAGKNEALFGSFLNSLYLACDIYENRLMYKEINKNPLPTGLPEELKSAKDGL
jgi:4-hydroxythreonine-4-phosphate dehydrogenase